MAPAPPSHLSEAGQRVVLIDRGPLASGTTPQAAGQTGYLHADPFALQFGRYCIEFFENFEQRTGRPIQFHQHGSLRVALSERFQSDLAARLAAAEAFDDGVEFISTARARQLVPAFDPPDDCQVLLIPRDGYVEPKSVAVAYAAAAADQGAGLFSGVAATGLVLSKGRVAAVQTSAGRIDCEWVVLAAGAWSRQFARQLDIDLPSVPGAASSIGDVTFASGETRAADCADHRAAAVCAA